MVVTTGNSDRYRQVDTIRLQKSHQKSPRKWVVISVSQVGFGRKFCSNYGVDPFARTRARGPANDLRSTYLVVFLTLRVWRVLDCASMSPKQVWKILSVKLNEPMGVSPGFPPPDAKRPEEPGLTPTG